MNILLTVVRELRTHGPALAVIAGYSRQLRQAVHMIDPAMGMASAGTVFEAPPAVAIATDQCLACRCLSRAN